MFSQRSVKKYINKLTPRLEKRYGKQVNYSASQVRTTVYQRDFNPSHLALGYIIALNEHDLAAVLKIEYPDLSVTKYMNDVIDTIGTKTLSQDNDFRLAQGYVDKLLIS